MSIGLTSTQNSAPLSPYAKTTLTINQVVLPGSTLNLSIYGTFFYFPVSTGILQVKPSKGSFSPYQQGEGLELSLENSFALLEIRNDNSYSVVFQLVAGFGNFIDKKLYLQQTNTPLVAYPTYPTPGAAAGVAITDISGAPFVDINGGKWFALYRDHFIVSSTDGGVALLIQKAGSAVSNGPAVAAVQPLQSIRIEGSGSYSLSTGGGSINAVVTEFYTSLARV